MGYKIKFLLNFLLLGLTFYLKFINTDSASLIAKNYQLQAILAFAIFYFVIYLASNAFKFLYSRKHKIPRDKKNNVHFGVENIANVLIAIAFMLLILSMFGVQPIELITSLTIVAAAFAILTKEYIADFLSGIYLSFSNTFEINDQVKIDNQKGKVVEISMLKVKILNEDDDIVIIPNIKVHSNEIINYTKRDARLMTIDFQIALKYIDSLDQLEKEIINSLDSFKVHIEEKSYTLKVVEMKMDYLDLKFQYTIKQSDLELVKKIRRKTIREVFNFISMKKVNQAATENN
jgi:small-conductance mechanosensitive channel